jgi:hypothetical protein
VRTRRTPFLVKAFLVTVLTGGALAWPLWALAGRGGLLALLLAAGVAFAGAVAGRLPRRLLPLSGPDAPVHAALAGVGTRLLVTAFLALGVVLLDWTPRLPFAGSLVACYLTLLVLEVLDALADVGALGRARNPNGAASR